MSNDKAWLNVFLRVNNRKKTHNYRDLVKAGYPMVEYHGASWSKLHDLCREIFIDGKGRQTYIWFGHRFFFLNEEDAQIFKGMQYVV